MNGEVAGLNLNAYTPMRMADVPELDIELVASTEMPVGMGEPATTVVGPAIGNAIFAAVGARACAICRSARTPSETPWRDRPGAGATGVGDGVGVASSQHCADHQIRGDGQRPGEQCVGQLGANVVDVIRSGPGGRQDRGIR